MSDANMMHSYFARPELVWIIYIGLCFALSWIFQGQTPQAKKEANSWMAGLMVGPLLFFIVVIIVHKLFY